MWLIIVVPAFANFECLPCPDALPAPFDMPITEYNVGSSVMASSRPPNRHVRVNIIRDVNNNLAVKLHVRSKLLRIADRNHIARNADPGYRNWPNECKCFFVVNIAPQAQYPVIG